MRRGLWFVAGAGAGVYAMVRARRAAEVFTPDGLRDRVAGLNVGAHLFAQEVRVGMAERETELRERLGLALDGPPELEAPDPGVAELTSHRGSEARSARTSTTQNLEGTP
jgi:hypothetical protein